MEKFKIQWYKKYIEKELKEEILKKNITFYELVQKMFDKNSSDYFVLDFNYFEVDFLKYLPS